MIPLRRITLHRSQRRVTEADTFIAIPVSSNTLRVTRQKRGSQSIDCFPHVTAPKTFNQIGLNGRM